MNATNLKSKLSAVAIAVAAIASTMPSASAQNIWAANAAFDAQFNQRLSAMRQQNNASIQALWQRHLQANGPRMQAQYRQLVASGQSRGMSYEQFAYWDLMSAAGTNPQGALAAQQRQFAGNQAANATVQSGHASYNSGYWTNQARQSEALNRSSTAFRGYAQYVDPHSGATTQLPYYLAQGQSYTHNNTTYQQDAQGTYYRNDGNGWTRLNGGR